MSSMSPIVPENYNLLPKDYFYFPMYPIFVRIVEKVKQKNT